MTKFEEIRENLRGELAELNRIISESLRSDNALMEHIVREFLKSKGKQIRPILSILTGRLFGGNTDTIIKAAASIELLHNASLIHDDVIDESAERRGRPTINRTWDNHIAVLVGDFFVSSALICAVTSGEPRVIQVMANRARMLSLGEISQLDNTRKHFVSEQSYYDTIRCKTAALFCSCVEVGGYAANADEERLARIVKYAELFGLCFQIKDDIFDYFDDTNVGKPTGNDLREGKVTLPLIHALEVSDPEVRREMEQILDKGDLSTADINNLIDFAKRNGGIEYAETKMNELRNEARKQLKLLPQNRCTESLATIFDYIIDRKI